MFRALKWYSALAAQPAPGGWWFETHFHAVMATNPLHLRFAWVFPSVTSKP